VALTPKHWRQAALAGGIVLARSLPGVVCRFERILCELRASGLRGGGSFLVPAIVRSETKMAGEAPAMNAC